MNVNGDLGEIKIRIERMEVKLDSITTFLSEMKETSNILLVLKTQFDEFKNQANNEINQLKARQHGLYAKVAGITTAMSTILSYLANLIFKGT